MEQSPSWKANRSSASQIIPHILCNPKVHYRVHKCPPPVLTWTRSVQSKPTHPTSWRFILILSSHLRLSVPRGIFPSFYGTRRFITAFTSTRHLSPSWASSIQSISTHPTSLRPILILSSLLYLGLPSVLFPSGFPTQTLYTPQLSLIRATCPAHLIILDLIPRTTLGEQYISPPTW